MKSNIHKKITLEVEKFNNSFFKEIRIHNNNKCYNCNYYIITHNKVYLIFFSKSQSKSLSEQIKNFKLKQTLLLTTTTKRF